MTLRKLEEARKKEEKARRKIVGLSKTDSD